MSLWDRFWESHWPTVINWGLTVAVIVTLVYAGGHAYNAAQLQQQGIDLIRELGCAGVGQTPAFNLTTTVPGPG